MVRAAIGAVGRYGGMPPRSKVSMMSIRPPQQGQGYERLDGSLASAAAGFSGVGGGGAGARRSRARPSLAARNPLAKTAGGIGRWRPGGCGGGGERRGECGG